MYWLKIICDIIFEKFLTCLFAVKHLFIIYFHLLLLISISFLFFLHQSLQKFVFSNNQCLALLILLRYLCILFPLFPYLSPSFYLL